MKPGFVCLVIPAILFCSCNKSDLNPNIELSTIKQVFPSMTFSRIDAVCFSDEKNGIALAISDKRECTVAWTKDGGTTWPRSVLMIDNLPVQVSRIDGVAKADDGTYFVNIYSSEKHTPMITSTDGGKTWSRFNKPEDSAKVFYSPCFKNANEGYFMHNRSLYKTLDGGKSYKKLADLPDKNVRNLFFIDQQTGFMYGGSTRGGYISGIYSSGEIVRTDDGGSTWHQLNFPPGGGQVTGLKFITKKKGTAITIMHQLYTTDDGGNSWVLKNDQLPNSPSFFMLNNRLPVLLSGEKIYSVTDNYSLKYLGTTHRILEGASVVNNTTAFSVSGLDVIVMKFKFAKVFEN